MNKNRLPLLVWLVLLFVLLSYALGYTPIGAFSLKGYAWLIPLCFSLLIIVLNLKKITFPIIIWTPWIVLVILYTLLSDSEASLQRSVMLICPMFVGAAVSSLIIDDDTLNTFSKYMLYTAVGFISVSAFKSGILITGNLFIFGDAAGMISVTLISCYMAVRYVQGDSRMLFYWGFLQIIPFIQITRMAALANLATLPLTLAPLRLNKRIIFILIVVAIGTAMFFNPHVQKKMFFSGSGSFKDLNFDNPDFKTHGRAMMWDVISEKAKARPWFGYGANASEELIDRLTGGLIVHPHNDYLRIRYDYGYVGIIIFFICNIIQMFHALKMAKIAEGETQILFYTGATAFIPFALLMMTDNIILYAAFFGNLQFTILGMAYAARNMREQIFTN